MTTIEFSGLQRQVSVQSNAKKFLAALGALVIGALLALPSAPAQAAGTLRIAMTTSDIPLPNGQTDQGAESIRFMGYTVFEALVGYDLS